MGDAYTALADGDYTLFYNPAILGRHENFSFFPFNPTITVINPLAEDLDDFESFDSDPSSIASVLMDRPIHLGLGVAPGFKFGRLGLSAIVNNQTHMNVLNSVTPMLEIDHRYDKGFIMGYGLPLKNMGSGKLSLGFSTKYIQRESLFGDFHLTSPALLNAFEAGELEDILSSLGKVNGSGWGFDLGLDYFQQGAGQSFSAGLAILDVYTKLHTDSNEYDREVQEQTMQVNFGTAWKMDLASALDLTLSADIRNLETEMEFMRRVRLGVEVGLTPALSVLGGLNANQYSYGVKTNTGLINLYVGFYNVDIGETLGEQVSKRIAIYLSLFDFTFDG